MKRMLDDEQIFELQELLEQVSISSGVVGFSKIHTDELTISDNGKWDGEGIEAPNLKLGSFAGLTHSFAELDETLQGIINNAIVDGYADGVACTQAQWDVIKALLNKSLYLSYDGYQMIKIISSTEIYKFGVVGINVGPSIEITYDDVNALLNAAYLEV